MTDDVAAAHPMLQIDGPDAAQAPYLSYNVPDPTSYPGRTYTQLSFPPERDPFGVPVVMGDPTSGPIMALAATTQSQLPASQLPPSQLTASQARTAQLGGRLLAGERLRVLPVTQPEPGETTGPGDKDDPKPSAVVTIVNPAPGTSVSAPAVGAAISVTVRVRFVLVESWPTEVALRVGDTTATATRTSVGTSTAVYAGSITVRPGTQRLRASVNIGATFSDENVLQVALSQDPGTKPTNPAPQLTIDLPPVGRDLSLPPGGSAVVVPFAGTVVDGDPPFSATCSVAGAAPVTLAVGADRRWSTEVQLDKGSHTLSVSVADAAHREASATRTVNVLADAFPRRRLFLVDVLRLSNFLGRYGAGRVVQTMSLLPGEKTTIAVRTFRSTKVEASRTESILESASQKSTESFEDAVAAENSTNSKEQSAFSAKVSATASGNWGVASASVSAEAAYNTASAREDAAKRVTNATRRHAGEKSGERTVNVEGKTSTTSSQEDEETITRELANTNLSRTLNFVFRQMTQEFVSLLHLVDVRVGLFTEWFSDPELSRPIMDDNTPRLDYEEVTLPQLRGWLRRILGPGAVGDPEANVANVYRTILTQLDGVFDYTGAQVPVIEDVERLFPVRDDDGMLQYTDDPSAPGGHRLVTRAERWQRFDPALTQTWSPADQEHTTGDPSGIALSFTVPGVLLAANVVSLRTDGVVCDAFLGGGPALDVYSSNLQRTAIAGREAEAAQAAALAARSQLGVQIVEGGETTKADLYAKVFPPPPVAEQNGAHP